MLLINKINVYNDKAIFYKFRKWGSYKRILTLYDGHVYIPLFFQESSSILLGYMSVVTDIIFLS